MKYIAGFARFWKNFLIGDSPILFVGTIVTIVVIEFTKTDGLVPVIIFPLLIMLTVLLSIYQAKALAKR